MIAAKLAGCSLVMLAVRGFYGDTLKLSKIKKFAFNNLIVPFTLWNGNTVYTVCKSAFERKLIKKYDHNFVGYVHNPDPKPSLITKSPSI